MNAKSTLLILFLVGCGCALTVYSYAVPVAPQQRPRVVATTHQFALLTVQSDQQVTWDDGGNDLPRTRTLNALYGELGGTQRPTLVNLLNVIGADRWSLVQTDQTNWTFQRRN